MVSKWVGLQSAYHNDLKLHFLQFNAKRNCVSRVVWVGVLWSLWNHRNEMVFKERRDGV